MKLLFTILFGIILSSTIFCQNNIINVPTDFPQIQLAIESAKNGDTILVSPGTYGEKINFRGKAIVVTSHFFKENDLSLITQTIINGGIRNSGDSASIVTFAKNETKNSILQGFTITNGKGTKTFNNVERIYFRTGGGILIDRASPTIRYNIITKNEAINKASVSGAGGGGIRAGQSKAIIMNNIITENKGGYAGGVMLAFCSGLTFSNNVVSKNSADGDFGGGSGIYIDWEDVPLINCTVTDNYSDYHGGAICITGTKNKIVNCIIYGNTSNDSSPVQIFKRNSGDATVTYTNIAGGFDGIGNMDQDPSLENDLDFRLNLDSPCIDSGDPSEEYFDPQGNTDNDAKYPARGTRKNDMGAYGGPNSAGLTNNVTSIKSDNNIPTGFYLEQNYPNPFNPTTKISYSIQTVVDAKSLPTGRQVASTTNVQLTVFDVLGEEVRTLVNQQQNAGKYEVKFDGSRLSSGIYYYSLTIDNVSISKKMVVLK